MAPVLSPSTALASSSPVLRYSAAPSYADYGHDVKDTQLVSPPTEELPSYHHDFERDSTLSTALHSLFSWAQTVLRSARLPDPSTVGFVLLCALWYMSSALSSNTGKSILTQFRYPVTLTFVQFAFVAAYSVAFLAARERIGSRHRSAAWGWGIKRPTRTMFHGTFVMSLFQIAGHVFSSMAIARVPVSTVHTIKALSPLFTVISYALLFRVRYGAPTYLALLPLTLGVMLACSFDLRANAVGFLCALGSTVIFVSQNIFSKKLLPKESTSGGSLSSSTGVGAAGKLDKLNLLFYSSGMAFFLMIPIWLYSDSSALINAWRSMPPPPSPSHSSSALPPPTTSLLVYFILNGTVHFAQNLLAFSILAKTSPVTYSIASLVKRIAVICLAIIWSGQVVTFIQGVGMTMTFGGLWMYNRAKGDVEKGERKRGQAEKRSEMFLPSSIDDARQLMDNTPPPLASIKSPNHMFITPPMRDHTFASHSGNLGVADAHGVEGVGEHAMRSRQPSVGGPGHQLPFPAPPPRF